MADEDREATVTAGTSLASSIGKVAKSKTTNKSKSRELFGSTIRTPPFAYAQIEVIHYQSSSTAFDALQARSCCDMALKQFLGATGAGIPLDLLKLDENQFWVRLPREDLSLFAAALAAWSSVTQEGKATILRLKTSGDWLGSLVGRSEQQALWNAP